MGEQGSGTGASGVCSACNAPKVAHSSMIVLDITSRSCWTAAGTSGRSSGSSPALSIPPRELAVSLLCLARSLSSSLECFASALSVEVPALLGEPEFGAEVSVEVGSEGRINGESAESAPLLMSSETDAWQAGGAELLLPAGLKTISGLSSRWINVFFTGRPTD